MIKYYPEIYGCISPTNYGPSQPGGTFSVDPRLKGRPRKTLKDIYPAMEYSLAIVMTDAQFAGWQTFWNSISKGNDSFLIDLYEAGVFVEREVHATGPFNASYSPAGVWDVGLQVEVFA